MKLKLGRKHFAFPYAAISLIFVIFPLFLLFYYSLTNLSGKFTFDNYIYFFTTQSIQKVMLRSLYIAFLTTVICLLLAYPLAYVLSNSKYNKTTILVLLFILPMWINFLLRTYAMKTFFSFVGIQDGFTAVIIGMAYDFFPFMLLPIYTILVNMDKSYLEASTDLGASPVNTFLKVTLPLSLPGIVSGVLMVFMPTISTFAISTMLGNSDTYLFGNIIDDYFSKNLWNRGSAFAFIMLLMIAITMLIAKYFTRGKTKKAKTSNL